jgi:hypothetical protein
MGGPQGRGVTPAVAARVAQLQAERDERVARARFRARHQAGQRARISALLAELVAVLAEGLGDELGRGETTGGCPACRRRLSPRSRTCPGCGWSAGEAVA